MLSPSTLTRLAEKLESKGLLRREAQGKTIRIHLTDQGEALGPALLEAWQETYRRYAAILGEGPARELTEHTYAAAVALEGG